MDGEKDETISEKAEKSFPWRGLLLWPLVIVVIYFLSAGPVVKIIQIHRLSAHSEIVIRVIYTPWRWAYEHTPMHKPLGIYLHLWGAREFDEHGEPR